ncbi:exportin-1 [Angomonas deanei]|uniref:CRM1 / Exportin repeat 2/CRM1 / Exportin repeat 3/CRM1 C terminal, putative n=1 Tax=Angomonas deanei TaxID=59799 RepID=A0A7G2C5C7_9TRYP|nr:exportin-1 [Angomonas deanei]CAD2214341.1 CRM1 / Exportin repeat 2/CRM1 / Exportin repeat 3/CRM1 C terminal, putative [Angomonas deanei]|eukprot:EPY37644.1 exportin-1 [Angomonas deanei]
MIIAFLQNYIKKILYDEILLVAVHEVLVGVSNVLGDKELFKTCVEYWQWIGEFMLRSPPSTMKQTLERRLGPVQSSVRFILVKRMAKPKEVIIVVEDGQVYRERVQDVEEVQMFELMQRTMITYTLLNVTDTRQIIISLLSRQLDGSEFTFDNINSLSWAAGSIGDVLPEEDEHCFFIEFLKGLLKLCKQLSGKQNRAVVASNILYFVGRYTRFLRQRWNFFRIVNKKVFEFMQDTFEGVQEMAVDTLYKLSHDLAPLYVEESGNITIDGDEGVDSSNCRNLAEAIAQVWPQKLKLLSTPLREVCFACAGCMVAVDNNAELKDPNAQRSLLFNFLREEQEVYRMLMLEAANGGANFLRDRTKMMMLVANLKMFSSIASTCGDTFVAQMELIISDLYGFYRLVGSAQGELAQQSNGQIDYDYARGLRLVKREILKLFENFVENSQQKDFIAQFCIPQLFEVVLVDYNSSEASVKEPVALALTAVAIDTLGERLSDKVAAVLDFTFATTVDIISKDFESHPEFRVNLFKLLKSLTVNCFPAFLNYVYSHAYIVDGLLWSIKHVDNVTMTTALETLLNFLLRINTMEDGSQANSPVMQFYQRFMQPLLREVFLVTLDSLHASGFQYHCAILQVLFAVSSSVNPADTVVGRQAVTNFLLAELKEIPAVTPTLLQDFIYRCFEYCGPDQSESFSSTIADFLVETRVWGAEEERRMLESETLQAPTNSLVM